MADLNDMLRATFEADLKAAEEAADRISRRVVADVPANWAQGRRGGLRMPPLRGRRYRRRVGRTRRTLNVEGQFHKGLRRRKRKRQDGSVSYTVQMRSEPHPRTGGGSASSGRTLSNVGLLEVQSRLAGGDLMRVSERQLAEYRRIEDRAFSLAQGRRLITGKTTINVRF